MTTIATLSGMEERARLFDEAWTRTLQDDEQFRIVPQNVQDTPLHMFVNSPADLRQVWLGSRQFGARDYLVYKDEHFTFDEAHRITKALWAWFNREGIRAGDRVAIAMRNYPEWMLVYWASVSAGMTVVGLNAWWVSEEFNAALTETKPKALFCDHERFERLTDWRRNIGDACPTVLVRAPVIDGAVAWAEVVATGGHGGGDQDVEIDPESDACIFFTSGTTGRSKGARLTHQGCVSNLMNVSFGLTVSERAKPADAGGAAAFAPKVLITTPLFHVTANNGAAHPVAALGGTLVLMYKWEPDEALRLIEAERITTVVAIPIMLREMLEHPDAQWRDLVSLTSLSGGGAPIPPRFLVSIEAGRAGPQMGTGYGMTELSGTAAMITGAALQARPGSCGRLLPTFEAKIVDDGGNVLGPGMPGELCIRGPGVIPGYLEQALDYAGPPEGGWMRTGDLAYLDSLGYIYLVDRKKDTILRGGENVYCAEVEAALLAHPDVAEACAFAIADERLGEEVGAAVFLRPGARVDADGLREQVGTLLARFKVPRELWFTQTPLPRNATGKFLRRQLQQEFAGRGDAGDPAKVIPDV